MDFLCLRYSLRFLFRRIYLAQIEIYASRIYEFLTEDHPESRNLIGARTRKSSTVELFSFNLASPKYITIANTLRFSSRPQMVGSDVVQLQGFDLLFCENLTAN